MAFPSIPAGGVVGTNGSTATTSPVVNLPSSIVAGETLFILIRNAAGGTITFPNEGTDWVQLFEDSSDASNDTIALAWRKASGSEGATVTLTFGTSGKFAALAWRVQGATDPTVRAPEFATLVTGSSDVPDPGSLSPTGGAKDYLWIWMGGWEGEQTSPPTGNPTNYNLANSIAGADSGTVGAIATNCRVATAARQLNAVSENPLSWQISVSDDWTATVIAVHPAPPAYSINAEPGAYALSGSAAGLLATRTLPALPGTYALTGSPATLQRGFQMNAAPGSYTLSGSPAGLLAARTLTALPGAYTLAGSPAGLLAGRVLQAGPGVYVLAGVGAALLKGSVIRAEPGAYVLVGAPAGLVTGRLLRADTGEYLFVGQPAGLTAGRVITAAPGAYVLTGVDAGLTFGAAASAVLVGQAKRRMLGRDAHAAVSRTVHTKPGRTKT